MTFFYIAANDLKLTFKDKMFFFWFLIFPLMFAVIFGLAFPESSSQDQKATINVLDHDHSFLSQALVAELSSPKYDVNLLQNETEKRIRTLIIPENFSQKIIAGERVELILEREADSNIQATSAAYSNILKAVIKILIRIISTAPVEEVEFEKRFSEHRLKRLITLKIERAGKDTLIPMGFNHAVPAVTIMSILFTLLMYGGMIILEERRNGQLERIFLSPASFASMITGKWLSRLFLGLAQITTLFIIGKIIFKTYYGHDMIALGLVSLFFCGTIAGMSILLGSIISKEEVLVIINILAANVMAALGGCWFPHELIPQGLRVISFIFPTGWTMDAFHKLIFFGYDLKTVIGHIGALFLFTLLFLGLAIRFFKLRKI